MSASGEVLLDTNVVLALFARQTTVLQGLAATPSVFVPSIVLGELFYGTFASTLIQANLERLAEFIATSAVLSCDAITARHFGRIKSELRSKGRPIPDNDIWIAALARQYGLRLVTRDAHFAEVEGLALDRW
jgi:tRNA(fMet)-specific endonuclease VapC